MIEPGGAMPDLRLAPGMVTPRLVCQSAVDGQLDWCTRDGDRPIDLRLVHMLAQAMVFEGDFHLADDHAALGYVLVRRAKIRGIPIAQEIREYVSGFKVDSARGRWIMELPYAAEDDCAPAHWPRKAKWRPEAWRAVLVRAYGVLTGTLRNPTPGATQYGATNLEKDIERAARAVKAGRWIPAKVAAGAKLRQAYFVEKRR